MNRGVIKINKIGTKIYYLKSNGHIILKTGDSQGWVQETTFEEDYENYSQLSQYNKDKIGLIQLKYGELSELLKEHRANTYTVDVSSEPHKLVFKYIEPETEVETEMPETLEEKVDRLEKENKEKIKQMEIDNAQAIVELSMMIVNK